jgi:NTE family protein
LQGIADVDPTLAKLVLESDVVVGTSAGAAVGAQITSGVTLAELYEAQLRFETAEIEVSFDAENISTVIQSAVDGASGSVDARRRIGAVAIGATTVDPAVRRAVIDARLPEKEWPNRNLFVTAVDAESGELAVFNSKSNVNLIDAVAASCAVPGVWPPVAIDGRQFIDGGVRSPTNADLVAGAECVLIILPAALAEISPNLEDELASLAPATVYLICADQASVRAFGSNALSPLTRDPAARAGRSVGASHAKELARKWP